MIGILVQLGISWLLLHYLEKSNLHVLGVRPVSKRLSQLGLGILFAAMLSVINNLVKSHFAEQTWMVNHSYTLLIFGNALWWCIKSVLFEELLFRGALFYIAIKRIGASRAMLLSSTCFGIYHWFTWNVLGDVKMMVISFVMTFLYGYTIAYSYVRTQSMLPGCGIHLGWNAVGLIVFSSGTIGNQFLLPVPEEPKMADEQIQTLLFFGQLLLIPLSQYLLVRFAYKSAPKLQ